MNEAAAPTGSARRGMGAVTLILLASVMGLGTYLLLRTPERIERVIPGPATPLPEQIRERAAQLEEEIRTLEEEIARRVANPPTCDPGSFQRGDSAVIASPAAALPVDRLLDRLERATALVVNNDTIATGFFVAPDLLLTNRHVVEGIRSHGVVVVASRSLGRAVTAQVVALSAKGGIGAPDFALIRLKEGQAPGTLTLSPRVAKLSNVVAAGYPGLTMRTDDGFRRLVGGDLKAAPDLNITRGSVQALQSTPGGGKVIVHSAAILLGNSGGPLVDACGRAIGINTFIAVDQEQSGRISYAQTAEAILTFLTKHGVTPETDGRECP